MFKKKLIFNVHVFRGKLFIQLIYLSSISCIRQQFVYLTSVFIIISVKYYLQLRLGKEILNLFRLLIFEYVIQQLAWCKVNVLRCTSIFLNNVCYFELFQNSARPSLETFRSPKARELAYQNFGSDQISRKGKLGHGVYEPAVN